VLLSAGRPKKKKARRGESGAALSQHKQALRQPASGLAWGLVGYFFRYSSTGLSFGLAQAALVASLAGRPTLVLLGAIGCMNHLS
jgi:hypothetical protein